MAKEFEFADFKMTSQDWNATPASHAVVNPSSDNGRSFWSSSSKESEEENTEDQ